MKANVFFSSTVAILFSSILFLAGCAGSSTSTSGGSSTQATFAYVRTDNRGNSGVGISGFRMNPDGTLAPLQGSPFSINGNLAVSGNFLLAANFEANSLTSYRIDPSSGSLTRAQTAVVPGSAIIAADSKTVYVSGFVSNTAYGIYAFSIDGNGSLAAISGSPFLFCAAPPECGPVSIGVRNSMLFAANFDGGLSFYGIQNGALAGLQVLTTDFFFDLAVHPSGSAVYAVNNLQIEGFTLSPDRVLSRSFVIPHDNSGGFSAVAMDPTGKFLAAIDNSVSGSHIFVFSIDPMTGSLTELGAPVSIGESGAGSIAFDPSGRFALITFGGGATPPNDVMVFSFDPASGTVANIQSAPTAGFAEEIVFATF